MHIYRRQGAFLPHWTADGATYSVTFRLADALPLHARQQLKRIRDETTRTIAGNPSMRERIDIARIMHRRFDDLLNAGNGSCIFNDPTLADLMLQTMSHFDGVRFSLLAWAVMPNHVHAVIRPFRDCSLPSIIHGWKSFSSHMIGRRTGNGGRVWQSEYFDHLIRGPEELHQSIEYVVSNPIVAGLVNWRWAGKKSAG